MNTGKKMYKSPTFQKFGRVERITAGGASGSYLDQSFPVGTPFDDVTFS
jgi:hypothetical protein